MNHSLVLGFGLQTPWDVRAARQATDFCHTMPACRLIMVPPGDGEFLQLSELMNFVPAGPEGFDRSLSWALLIAGSASVAGSPFRAMFEERCKRLGDAADFGSFGRVRGLLRELWTANDAAFARGETAFVRWRDIMVQKGWEYLLI